MMKKTVAILSLIFMMVLAASMTAVASAQTSPSSLSPKVQVPSYVYTGEHFDMYVNNTAGFVNYTTTVYFTGDNLTGFAPTNTYHNFSSKNPDFKVPMTAPSATQTLTLMVHTTGMTSTGARKSFSSTYTVKVINPIQLHASISNKNSVAMYNVSVDFYVDNSFVANKTVAKVGPGQNVLVNYTWLAPYLSNGKHTLTVKVNSPLISVDNQGTSVSSSFYYGHPPNYDWIYYIVAAVGVVMFFLAYGAGRRPRVGETRPKWKK